MTDLSGFETLGDLQILMSGNAIDYPPPNWFLLIIDYVYNIERPSNTLINRNITWFRWNLMVLWWFRGVIKSNL